MAQISSETALLRATRASASPVLPGGWSTAPHHARQREVAGNGVTCAASCLDQAHCTATETVGAAAPEDLPRCPAAIFNNPAVKDCSASCSACGPACKCWRVLRSDECNPARHGSPYRLQVLRKGEAPGESTVRLSCGSGYPWPWGAPELTRMPQC